MPESAFPQPQRRRPGHWILPGFLLALYLLIRLQISNYAIGVRDLQRQLDELRPALVANVLRQQLEVTRLSYLETSSQIRRMDLQNNRLLEKLSQLPPSMTLDRLEIRTAGAPVRGGETLEVPEPTGRRQGILRIEGSLRPGIRSPESLLVSWVQRLPVGPDSTIKIRRFSPSVESLDVWNFEVQIQDA